MELIELRNRIVSSFKGTKEQLTETLELAETDRSVFPFNEYEFLICNLMEKKG